MIYHCCDRRRRDALVDHPSLNGLDNVEVLDDPALPVDQRQRTLRVRLVNPFTLLDAENFRIAGGVRIPQLQVTGFQLDPPDSDGEQRALQLTLNAAGDFSRYTLSVVEAGSDSPPPGFDPLLSQIEFFFKAGCRSDLDCKASSDCPPQAYPGIEQGYLARDFESFRRQLLNHISVRSPEWRNETPADLGVALVEMLAYVGDTLSYRQDAVGTEAYLGTARLRQSVRRHARLVDYFMHEGCNSRVWLQLDVRTDVDGIPLLAEAGDQPTRVLTRLSGVADLVEADTREARDAIAQRPQVFELLHGIELYGAHNRMSFYTWGEGACCLPRGATRATLSGHFGNLAAGDVLILAELVGANTGQEADADPAHRHAVRLVSVTLSEDPLGGRFAETLTDDAMAVTEIAWHEEDALPFPLCLTARVGTDLSVEVAVAMGNVVAADHGMTVGPQRLPEVPAADPLLTRVRPTAGPCETQSEVAGFARYRPTLDAGPLTWAAPFDPDASAVATLAARPEVAIAQLWLSDSDGEDWEGVRDLLANGPLDRVFKIETDNDGQPALRFGDGSYGARPAPGLDFTAFFRIANGNDGQVGAHSLRHLVSADPVLVSDLGNPVIESLTNWLPAQGGVAPESLEEVRASAPFAFRTQERAVIAEDYCELARRLGSVQRVQATPRWTGSWYTMFVSVDREGGLPVDAGFRSQLHRHLQAYRMAGQDLEVDSPIEVPLDIELEVCVAAGYFPERVGQALSTLFHNGLDDDGRPGLFHPDRFSFGDPVFLSPLVAAAQAMPGVASIRVNRFQRSGEPDSDGRADGLLPMSRLEIARLDNDPNFPERGVFNLILRGMQ